MPRRKWNIYTTVSSILVTLKLSAFVPKINGHVPTQHIVCPINLSVSCVSVSLILHNIHLFHNPSPFFPFLCLRGNPTHPKMLHYNVISFICFLWSLSHICPRKLSSFFMALFTSLLYIKCWLVFIGDSTLFTYKLGDMCHVVEGRKRSWEQGRSEFGSRYLTF